MLSPSCARWRQGQGEAETGGGGYEKVEGVLGAWRIEEEVWRVGDRIPACSWALQGSLTQNSCMNFLVDAALQFQIQHLFLFFFCPSTWKTGCWKEPLFSLCRWGHGVSGQRLTVGRHPGASLARDHGIWEEPEAVLSPFPPDPGPAGFQLLDSPLSSCLTPFPPHLLSRLDQGEVSEAFTLAAN